MKYSTKDLLILADDSVGVIYHVPTGSFMTTGIEGASELQSIQHGYESGLLEHEDHELFEAYFDEYFGDKALVTVEESDGLDQRTELVKLELMVSTDCNLRCKYCYADGGHYNYGRKIMSADNAELFLNQIIVGRYDKVGIVMFFGGEPALSTETIRRVCEVISDFVSRGILKCLPTYTMVSNGTLIDDDLARLIEQYNIQLTVSLDGPKDINDQLRVYPDGTGSFDAVCGALNSLKSHNVVPALIESTFTKLHLNAGYTVEDISAYMENEFGAKQTLIVPCTQTYDGDDEIRITDETVLESLEQASMQSLIDDIAGDKLLLFENIKTLSLLSSNIVRDSRCSVGLSSVTVFPDGNLYPCHMFAFNGEFYFGNAFNSSNVLQGYQTVKRKLRAIQKSVHEKCSVCAMRNICIGCIAPGNGSEFGLLEEKDCAEKKRSLTKVLLMLGKIKSDNTLWRRFLDKISQQFPLDSY